VSAFAGQHVLSLNQFGRDDLELLFDAADEVGREMAKGQVRRDLAGRILISAFFDKSTRTRLAHETAMLRLGGSVSGFADAGVTRASGKTQEAAADVFRMLELYGDVIVTRHPVTGEPARAAKILDKALVINAGDGTGEHPTQALVDLYTIRQRFGRIDGLVISLVNDLRMRCTRSLLRGLRHYDCQVRCVAAPGMDVDPLLRAEVEGSGRSITFHDDLVGILPDTDVLYSSPTITAELPEDAAPRPATGDLPVTRDLLNAVAKDTLAVLHPLPRKEELSADVDETPFNAYFQQAANGVTLRMALLRLMLGQPAHD
jgi:aspartate carbamoyltransferase catalytic subunit